MLTVASGHASGSGSGSGSNSGSGSVSEGQRVIDAHLVTFESVAEMQKQNQNLLALTRELTQDLEGTF